jgi:CHAT domain-containing protein/tetratricopeptide (TPR) repeat protein
VLGLAVGLAPAAAPPPALTPEQQARLKEADRLGAEAKRLWQTSRHGEAEAAWQKKLALERAVYGSVNEVVARSVNQLAFIYAGREAFALARQAKEEVLAIRTRLYGEKDWRVTDARLGLEDVDLQARLSREQRGQLIRAIMLNDQVLQLWQQGRPRQALPLAEEALAIRRRLLGENHRDHALSLYNLGMQHAALYQVREAEQCYLRAGAIWKEVLGENHPSYAGNLLSLASLYKDQGDYSRALPLIEQARDIRRATLGPEHLAYATSLHNLAALYQALGDHGKALPLFEQARDIYAVTRGRNHPDYASTLSELASLYRDIGDHRRALPLYQQAREIRRATLGEKHPRYALSLINLASLYRDLGEHRQALPLYEQARDIYKATVGERHPDYASALYNLALLFHEQGDDAQALELAEQARKLRQATLGEKHPEYAISLRWLAVQALARDQTEEAERLLQRALTSDRAHLDDTFRVLNDRQRLNLLQRHRGLLSIYLSATAGSNALAARAYAQVLAAKGALASRHAEEFLARDQPRLRPLFDQLRQARAGLAHLESQVPGPELQKEWLKRFRELEQLAEQAEADLARQSDTFRRFHQLRQAGAAEVRAALPPDTVLIDFVVYTHWTFGGKGKGQWRPESRLLAFVLARDREVVCLELGEAGSIGQSVQAWREAVRNRQDPGTPGAELSRRLWAPLRKHLGKATVVLVSPDGVLSSLPFAALPGSRKGSWLLEEVAIGYLTSGRHLLELEADRDRPASSGLLALGGLDYGPPDRGTGVGLRLGVRRQSWDELPGSRREAERIVAAFRAAFPGERAARLLRGAEADAGRFQQEVGTEAKVRWRWLHLATHAWFDPSPPAPRPRLEEALTFAQERGRFLTGRTSLLCSGLVLSRANAEPERGGLSALEVSGLDLRGCELAVLSACDTGRGAVALGEGVLGLQWGFQAAGARTVVSSQWSISDAATSVLMEEFYAHLWGKKGASRLEALRQAQLTVLRHPDRVIQRARELRTELAKRGVSEDELANRGIGKESVERPALPRNEKGALSPVGWWAAFVLTGDWR